jgi:hypothetical protein
VPEPNGPIPVVVAAAVLKSSGVATTDTAKTDQSLLELFSEDKQLNGWLGFALSQVAFRGLPASESPERATQRNGPRLSRESRHKPRKKVHPSHRRASQQAAGFRIKTRRRDACMRDFAAGESSTNSYLLAIAATSSSASDSPSTSIMRLMLCKFHCASKQQSTLRPAELPAHANTELRKRFLYLL